MTDYDELAGMASDQVLDRVDNIFNMLLDNMERLIKTGTTANQMALAKTIIPALVRERANRRTGNDKTELKEFMDAMRQMRDGIHDPLELNQ